MIINMSKTKEIVFQRPSLKHFLAPSAVCGIEQVSSAKLLGVIFKNNLSFDEHVTAVLNVVVSVLIYLNNFRPGYVADTFGYCISCTYYI